MRQSEAIAASECRHGIFEWDGVCGTCEEERNRAEVVVVDIYDMSDAD